MSDESNVSRLDDLSVELFFEILQYLTPDELYGSMAHLNTRLNSILKKQPNLILVTKSHLSSALSFFDSFIALHIHFNTENRFHISQFKFLNLANIRSLQIRIHYYAYWDFVSSDELNSFIHPNQCPLLNSLHLSFCTAMIAEFIFTGAFRYLKNCVIDTHDELTVPLAMVTSLQTLRRLDTNGCESQPILSICPNLNLLHFELNNELPSFLFSVVCYPNLKHLQISRPSDFLFNDGQFDSLLALFPNLVDFYLSTDHGRQQKEIIDFVKVADCLRYRLPRLKKLEWCIYLCRKSYPYSFYIAEFPLIAQMHHLFKSLGKCDSLLHITSNDIRWGLRHSRRYVRPSSKS